MLLCASTLKKEQQKKKNDTGGFSQRTTLFLPRWHSTPQCLLTGRKQLAPPFREPGSG